MAPHLRSTVITALFAAAASVARGAEDWTQFLGPEAAATADASRDLPQKWDETQGVRWKVDTPGLGWSSPVVSGGKIYLSSAVPDGDGHLLQLLCYDAADGRQLWTSTALEQPADSPGIHSKNSHASPTPIVEGGRVYVHFGHQGTACLNAVDGEVMWTNREHGYEPVHGNGGSPLLVEEQLVFTCDGASAPYTVSLSTKDGKELWRVDRGVESDKHFSFCTPIEIEQDGRKLIISAGSDIVQAIDLRGEVVWSAKFEGFSVTPRPLYHRGLLYFSTGFGSTTLLAIDPSGSGDVTDTHLRWKYGSNVPTTPSPVAIDDAVMIISDSGVATALAADDGSLRWRLRVGGNFSATPLVHGDCVYLMAEDGTCTLWRLTGEKPTKIAENQLPGRAFASPVPYQGDLLIRTESSLYRIAGR